MSAGLDGNELDRLSHPGTTTKSTSRIESGEKTNPMLQTVVLAAKACGVRPAWLAFGVGPRTGGDEAEVLADMSALSFLAKLLPLRPLIAEVQSRPDKPWRLWHLAAVVDGTPTDVDGNPVEGTWGELLDEVASGQLPNNVVGGIERLRAQIQESAGEKKRSEPVKRNPRRRAVRTQTKSVNNR